MIAKARVELGLGGADEGAIHSLFTLHRCGGRGDVFSKGLRRISNQRRLFLHLHVWNHGVHCGRLVRLRHGRMLKGRRLMGKLMGRKSLGVLGLHSKRVLIGEMVVSPDGVGIEAMKMGSRGCGLASMHSTLRSRQRERGS